MTAGDAMAVCGTDADGPECEVAGWSPQISPGDGAPSEGSWCRAGRQLPACAHRLAYRIGYVAWRIGATSAARALKAEPGADAGPMAPRSGGLALIATAARFGSEQPLRLEAKYGRGLPAPQHAYLGRTVLGCPLAFSAGGDDCHSVVAVDLLLFRMWDDRRGATMMVYRPCSERGSRR
jgi:hypothetical protein